jgi:NAD(P)-dependent dehydrogenase (short-subunit alcohol dehydrogenase family)
LKKSQPSRIVNLSSIAHFSSPADGIHYDDLNNAEKYVPQTRYGESKMANIHFTRELQEKLLAENKDCKVYVNAVHPGVVKTELTRSMDFSSISKTLMGLVLIGPFKGALTQLYAAASPEIETLDLKGKYFVTYCTLAEPNAIGSDSGQAKRTWAWTQEVLQKQWKKDWKWNL